MMAVFKPITSEERVAIAEKTLRRIKMVCPRFSLPKDDVDRAELTQIWAEALFSRNVYPRTTYNRALALYAASASRDDNPPMPGDILRYCERAIEDMESDPVEREKLYAWRKERKLARIEQMTGEPQRLD